MQRAGIQRLIRLAGECAADARYAFRTWRRQPGFVAVAVISLAAGIGLNTSVFSIINTVFLQSIRGVPEPARVATIGGRSSFPAFLAIRDSSTTFRGVAIWQPIGVDLRYRELALRRVVPAASDGYFDVLGVRPAAGRFFAPEAGRRPSSAAEVVLDYEFWRDVLQSDPAVIGDSMVVSGVAATIVGVAPQAFHGFGPERPPLWVSLGVLPGAAPDAARWDDGSAANWRLFGRLKDEETLGAVNGELAAIAQRNPSVFAGTPPRAATGAQRWTGPVSAEKRIEFLLVVVLPLAVVALILWIGCSNVANLLLARGAGRRKEIAIRLASGASRGRIVRLLLVESLLLAFCGGAAGILLAVWTRDAIWAFLPDAPRLAVEIDGTVLAYTAAVCVLATMLFGLAPALNTSRVDVAPLLKGDDSATRHVRRSARLRTFFLVTQFASSAALLMIAGTFVRTLIATQLGERAALMDTLVLAYAQSGERTGPARSAFWTDLRGAIAGVEGVVAVTLSAGNPSTIELRESGRDRSRPGALVSQQAIDGSFFRVANVRLVRGTDVTAQPPPTSTGRVLVNERAARQLAPGGDVLEQQFVGEDGRTVTVAGVVRDDEAEPRLYERLDEAAVERGNLIVRTTGAAEERVGSLRAAILARVPDRTFTRVSTLREAGTGPLQRLTGLATSVAILVLTLATVGLYGSIAFITSQRTREIAIRLAVGAPGPAVLRLVVRHAFLIVSGGTTVGLLGAAVAFRFMSGMIFARWTLDPVTVAGVLAVFSAATLAACCIPARRAMRIDPMHVLRAD